MHRLVHRHDERVELALAHEAVEVCEHLELRLRRVLGCRLIALRAFVGCLGLRGRWMRLRALSEVYRDWARIGRRARQGLSIERARPLKTRFCGCVATLPTVISETPERMRSAR